MFVKRVYACPCATLHKRELLAVLLLLVSSCVHACLQDKYEVLSNQFASAGIKALSDIISPASKDLSR